MAMEIEIVSKELIKPTSPTPHHLRTHMLSFLDQFYPPIYVPIVLFYMIQETNILSNSRRSQLLKESLAETLTLFYPFAGRIKDRLSIDCNDEGAYFVEARVNHPLSDFLKLSSDSSNLSQLVPTEASWTATSPGNNNFTAMLQVTTFACGGIVLGANLSHMISDGPAATAFISSWATATCKNGDNEAACPNFDASIVFPQNVACPMEATLSALVTPFLKKGICRSMGIIFNASAIASLKAKTASSSVPDPTRVEAVSALLCKSIMATLNAKSDIQKPTVVTHSVNLRQRAVPKFPKYSMGNFVYMTSTLVTANETELDNLVCLLRKATRKVDGDFVNGIQGDRGWIKYSEHVKEKNKALFDAADKYDLIALTSWCNFGLYEIDFGWGKPTWVTYIISKTKLETEFANRIVLMDTKMGNGIEALVLLDEQHMVMLERNEELLEFGTLKHNLKMGDSVLEGLLKNKE